MLEDSVHSGDQLSGKIFIECDGSPLLVQQLHNASRGAATLPSTYRGHAMPPNPSDESQPVMHNVRVNFILRLFGRHELHTSRSYGENENRPSNVSTSEITALDKSNLTGHPSPHKGIRSALPGDKA